MRIFLLKPLRSPRTSQLLIILYNVPVDTKLKLFTATIIEIISYSHYLSIIIDISIDYTNYFDYNRN